MVIKYSFFRVSRELVVYSSVHKGNWPEDIPGCQKSSLAWKVLQAPAGAFTFLVEEAGRQARAFCPKREEPTRDVQG